MATLILRNAEGLEVGRRPMVPDERYELYRLCCNDGRLTFGHAVYTIETVAWKIPEEECICRVVFQGWEPAETPYDD